MWDAIKSSIFGKIMADNFSNVLKNNNYIFRKHNKLKEG